MVKINLYFEHNFIVINANENLIHSTNSDIFEVEARGFEVKEIFKIIFFFFLSYSQLKN